MPSRYQGVYERGRRLAFPLEPWELPPDAFGNDITCHAWFHYSDDVPVGRGVTPDAAYDDLLDRLEALPHEVLAEASGNQRRT